MNVVAPFEGIGASVRRKEDLRFLSGRGQYTDDIARPGQAHAFILRSPHAHARTAKLDGIPCGWGVNNKDGSPMAEPRHPVIAEGKARHVGDPVVVVVAETRAQAKDAAEAIEVEYEVLPAAPTLKDAVAPG